MRNKLLIPGSNPVMHPVRLDPRKVDLRPPVTHPESEMGRFLLQRLDLLRRDLYRSPLDQEDQTMILRAQGQRALILELLGRDQSE
jgi:hypothetical protein